MILGKNLLKVIYTFTMRMWWYDISVRGEGISPYIPLLKTNKKSAIPSISAPCKYKLERLFPHISRNMFKCLSDKKQDRLFEFVR